ncbi:hypothetical protein FRAHR75_580023 [Frankia sp. Hr75.2]|nr:hypothetical protein FRAHR75_580023 [Frankia sp. Hr75.2]
MIELVDKPDQGPPPPIPNTAGLGLPLLAHLAAHPRLLDVSERTRDRAMQLVQAFVVVAEDQGPIAV